MKSIQYLFGAMCVLTASCLSPTTTDPIDDIPNNVVVKTGPAESALVDLASADVWLVPEFVEHPSADPPIVWTLKRPTAPAFVTITRWCRLHEEPGLRLSDPPDVWKYGVGGFSGCGFNEYGGSSVDLVYDGTHWFGVSATNKGQYWSPDCFDPLVCPE